MKHILVLGAGQSAPTLIRHLLERAAPLDCHVTVADRDPALARRRVGDHSRGTAIAFDVNDGALRADHFAKADVVVNLMPPTFQPLIARDCVQHRRSMVSASYQDDTVRALQPDAERAGVLILTEVGLDPGFDLMSAMTTIRSIRERGGVIEHFESYGSGVPVPEVDVNPLRYCVTWNPRNIVMAAERGAQYRRDGHTKIVPWHHVFLQPWPFEVDGVGAMEAYPNRDSLQYERIFGLDSARTLIRGTLRYPGWCATWSQIVRLGLPNEHIRIPDLARRSYAEIVEMFLPPGERGDTLPQRVAAFLGIDPTGRVMSNLAWLGLFGTEPSGIDGTTAADAMIHLLTQRLRLPEGVADMVIVVHQYDVRYPDDGNRRERIVSTFTHRGEPGVTTAMARAVGLPAGVAVELILQNRIPLTGCHVPTHESIYRPILEALAGYGLAFVDRTVPVP